MSSADSARPFAVRVYARAAAILGKGSADAREAAAAFARLHAETRARGAAASLRLTTRALLDLAKAGWIVRRPRPLRAIGQDLRWSVRLMRRSPIATVAIVLSIGLSMGATTAAFSVLNAFLWRPWGDADAARVVRVREDFARPDQPPDIRGFSLVNFGAWQRENTVFESMAAGRGASAVLMWNGTPERVSAGMVTANFFDVIGVRPVIGRGFLAEEDAPARRDAVVLGDALWRARFGADSSVIGRRIDLNGRERTIVGVMPRGFKHPYQADLWVPLGYREDAANAGGVYVPARLKRGVTLEQANREIDAMAERRWRDDPNPSAPTGGSVTLLRPEMLGPLTNVLYALGATTALVLLIAIANVANLLLAQSLGRQTEAAIRTALGASRGRLIRQYLVHSISVSVAGGALGLLAAFWIARPLVALSPLYGAGEFDIEPRLDLPTLLFSFGLMLVVGAVLGVLPALRASKAGPAEVLAANGRSGTLSVGARRWLNGLVAAELTLAFVLVTAGVSIGRGFVALDRQPWGLDRRDVVTFDAAGGSEFVEALVERLRSIDGVSAVGATTTAPFYPGTDATGFNTEAGPPQGRDASSAHIRSITPGYLSALRIPLVAGRDFTTRDSASSPAVAIVSQSLAARYWPNEPAVGHRIKLGRFDGPAPWIEIAGVVGSLKENAEAEIPAGDALYLPFTQTQLGPLDPMTFVIKTPKPARVVFGDVADAMRQIDPRQPMFEAVTLEQRFRRFTSTERLTTMLTVGLGWMGLLLAGFGVYAVSAFAVRRRQPELGIRISLGARPADIRHLVLRESMVLAGIALIIGGAAVSVVMPWLDAGLPALPRSTGAAVVFAGVATLIAAMLASWLPARRAARISPITSLKA